MRRLDKSEIRHNIAARADHDMNNQYLKAAADLNLTSNFKQPVTDTDHNLAGPGTGAAAADPRWRTPDHIRLGIAKKEIEQRLKNRLHIGDPIDRKRENHTVQRKKNKFVKLYEDRPYSLVAPEGWEELDESDSDDTNSVKSQYSDTANRAEFGSLELPFFGQEYYHERHAIENTHYNRDTSMFEDLDADYDEEVS